MWVLERACVQASQFQVADHTLAGVRRCLFLIRRCLFLIRFSSNPLGFWTARRLEVHPVSPWFTPWGFIAHRVQPLPLAARRIIPEIAHSRYGAFRDGRIQQKHVIFISSRFEPPISCQLDVGIATMGGGKRWFILYYARFGSFVEKQASELDQ